VRRREFIAGLGGVVAWSCPARSQQPDRMRRVGVLFANSERESEMQLDVAAFAKALQELGWTNGRNIQIDYRWAAGDVDRMRTFAKELVSLQPDLIVGHTTPVVAALQRETRTIPIVFFFVSDPEGSGFVASLPRPGGNITGFINIESSLAGKWIEFLKEIAPGVTHAGLLFNPTTAPYAHYYLQPFAIAARSFAVEPVTASVRGAEDIERVVAGIGNSPGGGLVVMPDTFTGMQRNIDQIVSLAAHYRVPTIYPYRYQVAAGGLISYGIDVLDLYRRVPTYVDRILKGAKPADLPVQLPIKFQMAINLKTAKALGLTVPPTLLAIADEVIQ
jgi:putative tryptophan/tyrosine transport system substrate-binding protein